MSGTLDPEYHRPEGMEMAGRVSGVPPGLPKPDGEILTERQVWVLRHRPLAQWYPYEARALLQSHEALRAHLRAGRS